MIKSEAKAKPAGVVARLLAPLAVAGCLLVAVPSGAARSRALTDEAASRYALFAMMASNAYHQPWKRPTFNLEPLGWRQVDIHDAPTSAPTVDDRKSGLAYDIWMNDAAPEAVFAFRGTDSFRDLGKADLKIGRSAQYDRASADLKCFIAAHPGWKVGVTGHSLGGGIALGRSITLGLDAVAFDASPRMFTGTRFADAKAERVMISERGDPLELLRKLSVEIWKATPEENRYKARFRFGGYAHHRCDILALHMLNEGRAANPALEGVWEGLPEKWKSVGARGDGD